MNTHAEKRPKKEPQSFSRHASQNQSDKKPAFQFVDNRPEAIAQRKSQKIANDFTTKIVQRYTVEGDPPGKLSSNNSIFVDDTKSVYATDEKVDQANGATATFHDNRPKKTLPVPTMQRVVLQREITQPEKDELTELEVQIDTALEQSVMGIRGIVDFTLPDFVQNEIQIPRNNIPYGSFANLQLASQRYLAMVHQINALGDVVQFGLLTAGGALGNDYQAFNDEIDAIKAIHQVADHTDFATDDDPTPAKITECDTQVKSLIGRTLEHQGTTLQDTIEGGVDRNRQTGPEVTSVHKMLSLQMLEVKDTTAVYKSPYDQGVGRLGAEWSIKAGVASGYPRAREMAATLSSDWVLHGHVRNVTGNRHSKKITNMAADNFHLKDKATAGDQNGPSVEVTTADVRVPAETRLTHYMETIKNKKKAWKNWITNEYIDPSD